MLLQREFLWRHPFNISTPDLEPDRSLLRLGLELLHEALGAVDRLAQMHRAHLVGDGGADVLQEMAELAVERVGGLQGPRQAREIGVELGIVEALVEVGGLLLKLRGGVAHGRSPSLDDQWNCAASVEPPRAVVSERPPEAARLTASK